MIALRTMVLYAPTSAIGPPPTLAAVLSRRQCEVAILVADGKTNKQIAAELGITPETVRTYIKRVVAKLQITEGEPRVVIARTVIFAWAEAA